MCQYVYCYFLLHCDALLFPECGCKSSSPLLLLPSAVSCAPPALPFPHHPVAFSLILCVSRAVCFCALISTPAFCPVCFLFYLFINFGETPATKAVRSLNPASRVLHWGPNPACHTAASWLKPILTIICDHAAKLSHGSLWKEITHIPFYCSVRKISCVGNTEMVKSENVWQWLGERGGKKEGTWRVSKVKRGLHRVCSLVKAVLILWIEGVMGGDTLIGYRADR